LIIIVSGLLFLGSVYLKARQGRRLE